MHHRRPIPNFPAPMHRSRLVLALVACALLATAAFVRAESMEAEFELEADAESEAKSGAQLYPGDLDLRLNGLRTIEQAQAQAELNQIKVWRGRFGSSRTSMGRRALIAYLTSASPCALVL
jgi:hypothetical protein